MLMRVFIFCRCESHTGMQKRGKGQRGRGRAEDNAPVEVCKFPLLCCALLIAGDWGQCLDDALEY